MRLIICLALTSLLAGCQTQRVSNSARYISYWQPDDTRKGHYNYKCLEPVGPNAKSTDAELNASFSEVPVKIGIERNEDVTVSYAVTDEAQRLSTILYRLCEARGNEALTPEQYHDLVQYTLQRTGQVTIEDSGNQPSTEEEPAP